MESVLVFESGVLGVGFGEVVVVRMLVANQNNTGWDYRTPIGVAFLVE